MLLHDVQSEQLEIKYLIGFFVVGFCRQYYSLDVSVSELLAAALCCATAVLKVSNDRCEFLL